MRDDQTKELEELTEKMTDDLIQLHMLQVNVVLKHLKIAVIKYGSTRG